ncbi:hypothetical protein CHELA1G11_10559 [Hyphomicrobiales bacterium]|nr:hypothetical protein CHELA1G11_10559 [Hyphomicrobiales bacterium]CAH1673824.1 hypothetical protein CHELA1G2_13744 [Hyphomicrobiales bacterium]
MSFVFSLCTKTAVSPQARRARPVITRRSATIVGWAGAIAAGLVLWGGLAVLFGERDGRVVVLASDCAVSTYRDPVTGRNRTTTSSIGTLEKRLACGAE